jgi:hypothetical protein
MQLLPSTPQATCTREEIKALNRASGQAPCFIQTEFVGAGFMIGSAFAVVLPEGFEALYSAATLATHSHTHSHSDSIHDYEHMHADAQSAHGRLLRGPTPSVRATLDEMFEGHDDVFVRRVPAPVSHASLDLPCPRWAPGGALLAGFLAMMIFEFVHHQWESAHAHAHAPGAAHGHGCAHSHFVVRGARCLCWIKHLSCTAGCYPARSHSDA